MTEIAPHLGGYIPGGDPATYYPDLWRWLVEDYGVGSMIDVGCGEGHAINFFEDLGCRVLGIDGVSQPLPREKFWQNDYTRYPFPEPIGATFFPEVDPFDLVWSCEFVEHVEERYVPNFLETFKLAPIVLMTHAESGQQGHHHVNCRTADYWKGVLAAIGFQFDEQLTVVTRELASINDSPYNHYRRSGLAFRRFE